MGKVAEESSISTPIKTLSFHNTNMTLYDHLMLHLRHWKAIVCFTLIATIAAAIYTSLPSTKSYETILFASIGRAPSTDMSTSYDDAQAADDFTETVQGWFKNPGFREKIEAQTNISLGISAQKQEKQNLFITFQAPTEEESQKIAAATIQTLQNEIARYNANVESHFELALSSTHTAEKFSNKKIWLFLGFVFGLLAGIATSYGIEIVTGTMSFPHHVSQAFGGPSDLLFHSHKKIKPHEQKLLKALIKDEKEVIIINLDDSSALSNVLTDKKVHHFTFPHELDEKKKIDTGVVIVAVRLGKSRIESAQNLQYFLPEKYVLITMQT